MIRDDFGEFSVEKWSQGGSQGGESQKKKIYDFCMSDAVKIMRRFHKS